MCNLLNARLADAIDLSLQTRQAHWNVKGPQFIALHKLFDELNEAVEEYVDLIAERIVQLGGEPDFSPDRLSSRSHADYDESSDLNAMIRANLVAERVAIEAYSQMIALIGNKDSTTRRVLEGILSQEQEHADELSDWMTE